MGSDCPELSIIARNVEIKSSSTELDSARFPQSEVSKLDYPIEFFARNVGVVRPFAEGTIGMTSNGIFVLRKKTGTFEYINVGSSQKPFLDYVVDPEGTKVVYRYQYSWNPQRHQTKDAFGVLDLKTGEVIANGSIGLDIFPKQIYWGKESNEIIIRSTNNKFTRLALDKNAKLPEKTSYYDTEQMFHRISFNEVDLGPLPLTNEGYWATKASAYDSNLGLFYQLQAPQYRKDEIQGTESQAYLIGFDNTGKKVWTHKFEGAPLNKDAGPDWLYGIFPIQVGNRYLVALIAEKQLLIVNPENGTFVKKTELNFVPRSVYMGQTKSELLFRDAINESKLHRVNIE